MGLPAGTAGLKRHISITMGFASRTISPVPDVSRYGPVAAPSRSVRSQRFTGARIKPVGCWCENHLVKSRKNPSELCQSRRVVVGGQHHSRTLRKRGNLVYLMLKRSCQWLLHRTNCTRDAVPELTWLKTAVYKRPKRTNAR